MEGLATAARTVGQLTAIIDSVPAAIVMADAQGRIVLANRQAETLFGYPHAELTGQSVDLLVPERLRAAHPGHRAAYTREPNARPMGAGRALYGLRKDGSEFPIEIGLNPVDMDGERYFLSAVLDISEREQTRQLRQAVESLERSNLELRRFAYVASHDLQTPMRTIASFAQLLAATYEDQLDAQGQSWINRIVVSIRRLQALVRDLLDYSRIDSQVSRFDKVAMREVADAALLLLEDAIPDAGAEITFSELPVVWADRFQLVQLLYNLIGNAIKYRGEHAPRIHVAAERQGEAWMFSVRDNGMGIAQRHHERIFEMFQRLHDLASYSGTGIGLAVCRRVVELHGGKIWLTSELGVGTTFYFSISDDRAGVK